MSNVKTIKNAAEVHYLATGEYGEELTVFDIGEIIGCTSAGAGQLHCSKTWCDWLKIGFCLVYAPVRRVENGLRPVGDHTQTPGGAECWAKADDFVANQVCKSMGGAVFRTQSCPPSGLRNCQIYRLP